MSRDLALERRPARSVARRRPLKRAFDIVVAAIALLLLSPLFALVALAVAIDSPGPVLFGQPRVGLDGRIFTIWKFRSMIDRPHDTAVCVQDDPRVTRVGRVLRRTFVDELPQLWNVLRAEMSIVGPRPESPVYVSRYRPDELRVLEVRPGMAGPSTLRFSADEAEILARADDPERFYVDVLLHERVAADLTYVDNVSVWSDLRILLGTLWQCVRAACGGGK
jgi:lipopolysaccharide/colanic/teichoic acid biosynthesis glycosyltransferase